MMHDYSVINDVNNVDREKWAEFVFEHPHGNIFQTPEMYEVYENTKNYEPVFLAVVNNRDEIAGTLLAVIQKEYSGVLGNFSARSIIHGGPLIKDDDPGDVAEKIKLALEFGKRTEGREKIKHLDEKIIAEKIIDVYNNIVKNQVC